MISESTILHEIGHILGIGSIWYSGVPNLRTGTPITQDGEGAPYYTGPNALQEYKQYYENAGGNKSDIVGIPIEDSYGSASATSESSIAIDINGVNIEIQDAATGQTFRATGTGGGVIDANRCISHIEVPGMGKKTEKVLLTLREKDEMGILQEKAVLEVDLP